MAKILTGQPAGIICLVLCIFVLLINKKAIHNIVKCNKKFVFDVDRLKHNNINRPLDFQSN